jgi:hypothetical protein
MTQPAARDRHRQPMRTWVVGVVIMVVGVWLSACSSDAQPSAAGTSAASDICGSAEDLRGSLSALGDVQVTQEGTSALENAWTTVQDDWAQLADDARERYAGQVGSVQTAADAVQAAMDTALADPSAQALRGAAAAIGVFVQEAGALTDEVGSTC